MTPATREIVERGGEVKYHKVIEITDTGMVFASVYCDDRRVGLKWFDVWPIGVERKAKKAHEWADKHMATCQEQECGMGLSSITDRVAADCAAFILAARSGREGADHSFAAMDALIETLARGLRKRYNLPEG